MISKNPLGGFTGETVYHFEQAVLEAMIIEALKPISMAKSGRDFQPYTNTWSARCTNLDMVTLGVKRVQRNLITLELMLKVQDRISTA